MRDFDRVASALEAEGIEYLVWNTEVMFDPDTSPETKVELEVEEHLWDRFIGIVRRNRVS